MRAPLAARLVGAPLAGRLAGILLAAACAIAAGPAIARTQFQADTRLPCASCHNTSNDSLNAFGQAFRSNGYRLPPTQPAQAPPPAPQPAAPPPNRPLAQNPSAAAPQPPQFTPPPAWAAPQPPQPAAAPAPQWAQPQPSQPAATAPPPQWSQTQPQQAVVAQPPQWTQQPSAQPPGRTTQHSAGFVKINDSCGGKGGNRWKLRLGGRADMELWMTLDPNANLSIGVPQGTTFSFACNNAEPPPPPANQFLSLD